MRPMGFKGKKARWARFYCEFCKKIVERRYHTSINYKSCGCSNNTNNFKHGMSETRLYHIWEQIKRRCTKPKNIDYVYYGGRGIDFCKDWDKFLNFANWAISNGYKDNLQIDRINNNKGYSPTNCRWVTSEVNARNKRNNVLNEDLVVRIRRMYSDHISSTKIAKMFNVHQSTISRIVNNKIWKDL